MNSKLSTFYRWAREERMFCAILFHLLLSSRENLQVFVDEINSQLAPDRALKNVGEDAQIYIEFTYLRDSWFAIGRDDEQKRAHIFDMFERSPILGSLTRGKLPAAAGPFNELFAGPRGARVTSDILYPGQWSVAALHGSFGANPEIFRELCRVKWSFNIKPDLVVLTPETRPICVEAKLESREGSYPTSNAECAIFDELFGVGARRVKQVELQQFMFATLLDTPCQPIVVGRSQIQDDAEIPFLTWDRLFSRLDASGSLPFVERLTTQNEVLRRGLIPDEEIPPDSLE